MESARTRKYELVFYHLRYLLSSPNVQKSLFRKYNSATDVGNILDLLRVWQCMNPSKRSAKQHVEYETDAWISAFTIAAELERVIEPFSRCYAPVPEKSDELESSFNSFLHAITGCLLMTESWCQAEQHAEIMAARAAESESETPRRISDSGFHTVALMPGSDYLVPEFVVSAQPVSFHHPSHAVLSYFLSYLPQYLKLLKEKIPDPFAIWDELFSRLKGYTISDVLPDLSGALYPGLQFSSPVSSRKSYDAEFDMKILRLMEEPLRVIVLLSQIGAGIWVRNGASVRSMAIHYREVTLSEWYDHDIYLLQVCANLLNENAFLTAVLDRFELMYWLKDGSGQMPEDVDASHMFLMLEDMLQLLITLLTERSSIDNVPVVDQIQREIVHHLATAESGMAYSDLTKRVPERLLEFIPGPEGTALFDSILYKVASFKYPEGIADRGLYELKKELYDSVDPWFWHFSKNQREEVEEILRKKQEQKGPKTSFYDIFSSDVPKQSPVKFSAGVNDDTGFLNLNRMVHSPVFVGLCVLCLEKAVQGGTAKYLSIINQIIYLALIACKLQESFSPVEAVPFSELAASQSISLPSGENKTLIDSLLSLLEKEEELGDLTRVKFLLQQLVGKNGQAKSVHDHWLEETKRKYKIDQANDVTDGMTEAERKKKAAQARKAAIMAQFAQAQQTFIETAGDEYEHDVDMQSTVEENENIWEYPSGSCIVCQEDVHLKGPAYGMVGYCQPTVMKRFVDFEDANSFYSVLDVPKDLDVQQKPKKMETETSNPNSTECLTCCNGNPGIRNPLNEHLRQYGIHATSCGHLMHFKCFETYISSIKTRQTQQTTRNHPEDLKMKEFLCPLCKSLGNMLLPLHFTNFTQKTLQPIQEGSCLEKYNQLGSLLKSISSDLLTLRQENLCQYMANVFENLYHPEIKNLLGENVMQILSFGGATNMPGGLNSSQAMMSQLGQTYKEYQIKFGNAIRLAYASGLSLSEFDGSKKDDLSLDLDLLSTTISAIEIMSRGSGNTFVASNGILDTVNHQNLTLLRVLARVIELQSYLSFKLNVGICAPHLNFLSTAMFNQAMPRTPTSPTDPLASMNPTSKYSIFKHDPFSLFVSWVCLMQPYLNMSNLETAISSVSIFWVVSVYRSLMGMVESVLFTNDHWMESVREVQVDESIDEDVVSNCIEALIGAFLSDKDQIKAFSSKIPAKLAYAFVKKTTLPFLRKSALFLYAKFGVTLAELDEMDETDEYARLSAVLQVPSLLSAFDLTNQPTSMKSMVHFWVQSFVEKYPEELDMEYLSGKKTNLPIVGMYKHRRIRILTPIVYEFVTLPNRLDTLLQESIDKTCKRCNTEPNYSAWCLICGEFLCSQSFCCSDMERGYGELSLHKRKYGLI